MSVETLPRDSRTQRFARRRAQILDVASAQINVGGLRGMTLTAVAKSLGLDTSSVTYYFRRKEDLASACLERSLQALEESARAAAAEGDPRARARRFLRDNVALHRRLREPGVAPLALLSDMSALEEPVRAPLDAMYRRAFETVRGFFDMGQDRNARSRSVIGAYALLADVLWLPAWIHGYLTTDLDRVADRLAQVLEGGLGAGDAWPVDVSPLEVGAVADPQTRFLHAATNLINLRGYQGASVEAIARELGVSTGSFYHHLDNKDDLVAACFERSFDILRQAQLEAEARGGSAGDRLGAFVTRLVAFQFTAGSPLLRTSAYQALPPDLREVMLARTGRVTLHVAGVISDGIAQGSLAAVDPLVASHAVVAAIHAAPDMRAWASRRPLEEAVALYVSALEHGLFHAGRPAGA